MLTVTKSALQAAKACEEPMALVERHFRRWGDDTPIPLIRCFGLVSTPDLIWALRCAEPAAERDVIARLFAADCAERVLPLYGHDYPDDDQPRRTIEIVRSWARSEATDEKHIATLSATWMAAWARSAWAAKMETETERAWRGARLRQYLEHGPAAESMACEAWRPETLAEKEE